MRERLEGMRDSIVAEIADNGDRDTALFAHDSITEMIDAAVSEALPASIVQVAPVVMVRDMLNECLSNALTPLPTPKKDIRKRRDLGKKNKKKVVKARTAARKLKRSTR